MAPYIHNGYVSFWTINSSNVVMFAEGSESLFVLYTGDLLLFTVLHCQCGAHHSTPPAASHIKGVGCAEPSIPRREGIKQPIQ